MLRKNIKYGDGVNLYLNGRGHHYSFYAYKHNQHSFLIPRTHFSIFENDFKQFYLNIVFKSDGKFYIFEQLFDDSLVQFDIYENIRNYENYFEFKVIGKAKTMDEVDIRDFRINTILENEI
jgi:hypothetical protein